MARRMARFPSPPRAHRLPAPPPTAPSVSGGPTATTDQGAARNITTQPLGPTFGNSSLVPGNFQTIPNYQQAPIDALARGQVPDALGDLRRRRLSAFFGE